MVGIYDCGAAGGTVHLFLDVQLFLAQTAVVDGDGSCCPISRVGIGGGIVGFIKDDLTDLLGVRGTDVKLACKHSFDLLIGQLVVRCFGEGIGNTAGNGFVVSQFIFFRPGLVSGAGVSAVSVLGHIFVRGSIDGDRVGIGRCVRHDRPVIVVGIAQRLIDRIGRGGGRGYGLGSAPIDLLHIVEVVSDNFVARSLQLFNGFVFGVLLQQVMPCKLFLLFFRKGKGDILLGDDVGLLGNGIAGSSLFHIGRRGHTGFSLAAFPLKTLGNGEGTARSMRAGGGIFGRFPRDRTGSDISRAGNSVLLGVGLARFIGQIGDIRRILRGSGLGVVQGIGLTVESVGEGVIGFVERALRQCFLCLRFSKIQLFQSVDHRIVAGFGLCSGFGLGLFSVGLDVAGHGLFRGHTVGKGAAQCIGLVQTQLSVLTVADVVDLAVLQLEILMVQQGEHLFVRQLCRRVFALGLGDGIGQIAIGDGVNVVACCIGGGGGAAHQPGQFLLINGERLARAGHGDLGQDHLGCVHRLALMRALFKSHAEGDGGVHNHLVVLHMQGGGAGALLTVLIGVGLGAHQIVGIVVVVDLGRIGELCQLFGTHLTLKVLGFGQGEGLGVAIIRRFHIVHIVAVELCVLLSVPVGSGLAQLLFQIDLISRDFFPGVRLRIHLAAGGGRGSLGAGGHGGSLNISRTVRVRRYLRGIGGVRHRLCAGVGGHDGVALSRGLGQSGFADRNLLFYFAAGAAGVVGAAGAAGAVGVAAIAAAAAAAVDLGLLLLFERVLGNAGLGGGIAIGIRLGFAVFAQMLVRGQHVLLLLSLYLGVGAALRCSSNGCRSRAFPFRLGLVDVFVIRDGVHIICRIRDQGLGRNTCGQCHRHCSNFKLFVRHDPRSPFLSPCV